MNKQNELEIEIKLVKDAMKDKVDPEELEKTNSKVARFVNNTDRDIKKLNGMNEFKKC